MRSSTKTYRLQMLLNLIHIYKLYVFERVVTKRNIYSHYSRAASKYLLKYWQCVSKKDITVRKIPKFHLISWFGSFVERHIFHSYLKLCGNCTFPQDFRTKKLGKITVFYAVKESRTLSGQYTPIYWKFFFSKCNHSLWRKPTESY